MQAWTGRLLATLVSTLPIGVQGLAAQQEASDPGGILVLSGRAPRSTKALRRLLHQEGVDRWRDGWALVERIGPALAASLAAEFKQKTNAVERLVLLGAIAAAGGGRERDLWLLSFAASKPRADEEAVMALLAIALSASPADTAVFGDLFAAERGGSATRAAAALAACRLGVKVAPEGRVGADLHELIEQALFTGATQEVLRRARLALGRDAANQGLVLRAAFLGLAGRQEHVREAAIEVVQSSTAPRDVRVAAATYLADIAPEAVALGALDAQLRVAWCTRPLARLALWNAGALPARAEVLADRSGQLPLAAAYGLTAPFGRIQADFEQWAREPQRAEAVVLALAWRLHREAPPPDVSGGAWLALLEQPGGFWLATALGRQREVAAPTGGRDARAAALAAQGRLPAEERVLAIEQRLWQLGAHPCAPRCQAWNELVRDVLLAGSDHVSARLQLAQRPNLPRGIEPSHTKFFVVADQLARFLTERELGPPPGFALESRTDRR